MTSGICFRKPIFILASGPSLKRCDLRKLYPHKVMALNRSIDVYPGADYHCSVSKELFDRDPSKHHPPQRSYSIAVSPNGIHYKYLGEKGFSLNPEQGIYYGHSISYFALQIAFYLGFNDLIFLGLDLSYEEPDSTHFFGSDDYMISSGKREFPLMEQMLQEAFEILRQHQVYVYNCGKAKIDGLKAISYEAALASSSTKSA